MGKHEDRSFTKGMRNLGADKITLKRIQTMSLVENGKTLTKEEAQDKKKELKDRLFRFVKESELGIGHKNQDSLHNECIQGYTTDLTDEVDKRSGRPITAAQATDQRLNERSSDVWHRWAHRVEEPWQLEETMQDIYDKQEDAHSDLARLGFGDGLPEWTPAIQRKFIQLVRGEIHTLSGLDEARQVLREVYESEVHSKPENKDELEKQLNHALDEIKKWRSHETEYLYQLGVMDRLNDSMTLEEKELISEENKKARAERISEIKELHRVNEEAKQRYIKLAEAHHLERLKRLADNQ